MEKQAPTWIFPVARFIVNWTYYLTILAAAIFTFISILGLLNMQPPALTFGEESPNGAAIPVEWIKRGDMTIMHSDDLSFSLSPSKRTGELRVPIRSTLGLTYTFFAVMGLAGGVWFLGLLRQIFHHSRANSPFHSGNARRISQMGLLIIAFSLLSELNNFLMWMLAKPYVEVMSPEFNSRLSYSISLGGTWIYGLVLLALAQLYRRGVELQQENELTV